MPSKSVMARDHRQPDQGDRSAGQMNNRRQRDHRHADRENHLGDKVTEMDVEAPAEPHDRELDQDQPEAARDEETADVGGAVRVVVTTLRAVQKCGNAGQEDESRRAEMRHPARQEQRRVGDVARIEAAIGKKIAGVVEGHHDHHQAAQRVDRTEARAFAHCRHFHRRHLGWGSVRQCGPLRCIECDGHDGYP